MFLKYAAGLFHMSCLRLCNTLLSGIYGLSVCKTKQYRTQNFTRCGHYIRPTINSVPTFPAPTDYKDKGSTTVRLQGKEITISFDERACSK